MTTARDRSEANGKRSAFAAFLVWITMAVLAVVSSAAVALRNVAPREATPKEESRRILREDDEPRGRLPRTLVGIFSSAGDAAGRDRYRRILEGAWGKDDRVCSLAAFLEDAPAADHPCLLVYTFVVGAANDPGAPTELLDARFRPLLAERIAGRPDTDEIHRPDVTLLNIRENIDEGKSQTFFYYASTILGAHRPNNSNSNDHANNPEALVDYCLKVRASDTLLSVGSFLDGFVATGDLPPPPYARGILGGVLRDKAYDSDGGDRRKASNHNKMDHQPTNSSSHNKTKEEEEYLPRLESFWGNEFEGVHLYVDGQLYLLSMDLVDWLPSEAPLSRTRVAPGGYSEGREDHDVSGMVFHSPTPVHMLLIANSQRFWEHPLRTSNDWEAALGAEEGLALA